MRNKKSIYLTGMMFFMVSLIMGCTRQDIHRERVQQQGKKRAKGQPLGQPVSRMIDVSGGRVVSGDGRVTLIIPPGAVVSPTLISIQPISSTLPLSLAASYRMEPEGQQFLFPVSHGLGAKNVSTIKNFVATKTYTPEDKIIIQKKYESTDQVAIEYIVIIVS
jgi:hypothetical protein